MIFEGTIYLKNKNVFKLINNDSNTFLLKNKENFISYINFSNFEYEIFTRVEHSDSTQFEFCNFDINSISNLDLEAFLSKSKLDIGLFVKKDGSLKLSRNQFGTVPLYYIHIPNIFFSFSTSLSSLVQKKNVQQYLDLNIERISSYCTFRADTSHTYNDSTFYKHIKTILPGHILHVTPEATTLQPYLFFDTEQWSNLKDTSDYSNQLLKALKASVEKAARHGNIASHLSGGMDSSSISALTKLIFPEKPLHTLYADTDTDLNRESAYAKLVAENIASIHHEVKPATNDFEVLSNITAEYGYPECSGSSPALHTKLMSFASAKGCTVLLNGFDGDTIIGAGYEYLIDLVNKKDWITLKEILLKRSKEVNLSYYYSDWDNASANKKYQLTVEHFLSFHIASIRQQGGVIGMFRSYLSVKKHFDLPHLYLLKKLYNKISRINNNDIHVDSILKSEYTFQNRAEQKIYDKLTNSKDIQTILNISYIFKRLSIQNNENHFILSNYFGIHNKMPMYDKAIIEICAATPNKFKYANGFGRKHFRDAMADILPPKVNNRVDKGIFSLYARESVLRIADQAQAFLTDDHEVWKYIDRNEYYKMKQILQQDNQHVKTYNRPQFHVSKTVSLAIWLSWLQKIKDNATI